LKTYYEILDVETTSSPDEIKRAFRRRVKELHPDVNPFHAQNPDGMHGLLRAYETLIDPLRREEYDRRNLIVDPAVRFDYREFLKSRSDDHHLQAKLVFFDLLHQREDEAVELYEALRTCGEFCLDQQLDREDYMDCAFLLAEEYEARDRYRVAYELLMSIVLYELEKPYFRHFFFEVTERMRSLVCFKMPMKLPPREVIGYINALIVLDLPAKDTAFYLKKAAELYLDLGDATTATAYLRRGLELDEKLAGTKKLRERLAPYHAV
jgi:tetratricopeptide (TPR) repeat protein